MDKKLPYGVLVAEKYTPEDFIELDLHPLEWADIPNTVRLVIMSSVSVLYEGAKQRIVQLKEENK